MLITNKPAATHSLLWVARGGPFPPKNVIHGFHVSYMQSEGLVALATWGNEGELSMKFCSENLSSEIPSACKDGSARPREGLCVSRSGRLG